MATFPAIQPSYGAEKKSQPKLQVISFGDGYEQRVSFGINQNPKVKNKKKISENLFLLLRFSIFFILLNKMKKIVLLVRVLAVVMALRV